MGMLWSFINPLLMLVVYTFVFSVVFKAKWNIGSDSRTEFALVLFAGLIVFNFFSECINRSPVTILNNTNLVKKVIFPLEILPWVALGSAAFHLIVSLSVWFLAYLVIFGLPHITILLLPIIFLPLFFLTLGLSLAFASLGVYLRDLPQLLSIAITVLMFLSPIFYPASSIPLDHRFYLNFNPLTPLIEMSRDVMYFGDTPPIYELVICLIISLLIAFLGYVFFQKTRKGFADVL